MFQFLPIHINLIYNFFIHSYQNLKYTPFNLLFLLFKFLSQCNHLLPKHHTFPSPSILFYLYTDNAVQYIYCIPSPIHLQEAIQTNLPLPFHLYPYILCMQMIQILPSYAGRKEKWQNTQQSNRIDLTTGQWSKTYD